jgi:hypothetical protein
MVYRRCQKCRVKSDISGDISTCVGKWESTLQICPRKSRNARYQFLSVSAFNSIFLSILSIYRDGYSFSESNSTKLLQLFLQGFFQCWQYLVQVANHSIICNLKNGRLLILVNRHNHLRIPNPSHMLNHT